MGYTLENIRGYFGNGMNGYTRKAEIEILSTLLQFKEDVERISREYSPAEYTLQETAHYVIDDVLIMYADDYSEEYGIGSEVTYIDENTVEDGEIIGVSKDPEGEVIYWITSDKHNGVVVVGEGGAKFQGVLKVIKSYSAVI